MSDDNLIKIFNLSENINLTNLIAFDENNKLKKYKNQYELIDDYYIVRKKYYNIRKENLIKEKKNNILLLENRVKFITYIINKKLHINNRKKIDIELDLIKFKFDKIDDNFNYLLNMYIITFSEDKINNLNDELIKEKNNLNDIIQITIEKMWINDLKELKKYL